MNTINEAYASLFDMLLKYIKRNPVRFYRTELRNRKYWILSRYRKSTNRTLTISKMYCLVGRMKKIKSKI